MLKKRIVPCVLGALYVLFGAANNGYAQTAKLFAVSRQGGLSTNEVFRYAIEPTGDPTLDLTITDPTFDMPFGLAFDSKGEMFVINSTPSSAGSVSCFLSPAGTPVPNGTITSSSFSRPHGAAFRMNELFIAQADGGNVIRFVFDDAGNASFNGVITDGLSGAVRGITVNAQSELFVTECCGVDEINRYLFDGSGNAIPNGVITGGGLSNPHDMVFSSWGELFVASAGNNGVSRFTFDALGNATPNGQIIGEVLNTPIGLAFSPWDELFVSNHNDSRISRWTFDASFNAIPNGSFITPQTLGDIEFSVRMNVPIDIKPGNSRNTINPNRTSIILVAIFTTSAFDATTVVPSSIRFGPAGAEPILGQSLSIDVDRDGDRDMLIAFRTQQTGIQCGDTEASLTGQTYSGQAITGTDAIQTVGCGSAKAGPEAEAGIPEGYALLQNYPNPFNPETEIRFQLPEAGHVVVKIFNTVGEDIRTLVNEPYQAGYHRVRWDGKDKNGKTAASGVYFYQLRAGSFVQVRKMSLLR